LEEEAPNSRFEEGDDDASGEEEVENGASNEEDGEKEASILHKKEKENTSEEMGDKRVPCDKMAETNDALNDEEVDDKVLKK